MPTYNISYPEFMNHIHEHLHMSKYQKRFLKDLEKEFVDTELYQGDGNFHTRVSITQCETGKHKHSYWITFRYDWSSGQDAKFGSTFTTTKTLWCKGVENDYNPTWWWRVIIRDEIHMARFGRVD